MSRRTAIIINITIALAVVAYLVLAIGLWQTKEVENRCKNIQLEIIDSSPYRFINDSVVNSWITEAAIPIVGRRVSQINLFAIESMIRRHHYVDSCEVYTSMTGTLQIKISQAIPLMRFMTDYGYDFYVDSALRILPIETYFRADVPIISGNAKFNFSPQYVGKLNEKIYEIDKEYLKKIINFVRFISADEFLQNLIVQIYVNDMGDIELIPRIGDQIIVFGSVDDCDEKLRKLKKFYQKSLSDQWWLTAKIINIKYKNQVIVT